MEVDPTKHKGRIGNRVVFVKNNYSWDDVSAIEKVFARDNINYGICGLEIGKSGTPHLQGFLSINVPDKRKWSMQDWKTYLNIGNGVHLIGARGDDASQDVYCSKDGPWITAGTPNDSAQSDIWSKIFEIAKTGDYNACLEVSPEHAIKYGITLRALCNNYHKPKFELSIQLRDWQEKAIQLLKAQNDRNILFVVDIEGGKGKSILAKWIFSNLKAWGCQGGKQADLMQAYNQDCEYAVFDMARCNESTYWPWSFMENLKNGWFTSTKYMGLQTQFEAPKIIVFTNEIPNKFKLSMDRYQIYEL